MWGFVGEMKSKGGEEEAYIFTHKVIDISYNKDRVGTLLLLLTPSPKRCNKFQSVLALFSHVTAFTLLRCSPRLLDYPSRPYV